MSFRQSILASGIALLLALGSPISHADTPPEGGKAMLPDDSFPRLRLSTQGGAKAQSQPVKVDDDVSFKRAMRVAIGKRPDRPWNVELLAPTDGAIKRGDVLFVRVWARAIRSDNESGDGKVSLIVSRNGPPYDSVVSVSGAVGRDWTPVFKASRANKPLGQGEHRVAIHLGDHAQTIEVGGLELTNYGPDFDLRRLPAMSITYDGRAADAKWRKAAARRIEQHRKADIHVRVLAAEGKPAANVPVRIEQVRHAFGFGNIINPGAFALEGRDGETYRRICAEHFNKVTFESGFRWHNWYRAADRGELDQLKQSLNAMIGFCQKHDIAIRGHFLSWAPFNRSYSTPTDYMKQPKKLWPELSAHMDRLIAFDDGRLAEWDVVNHIVGWGNTMATATGSDEIYAKIIRHARSKTKTPMWVNEGQILPGGGRAGAYEDMVAFLVKHEAKPDGIGFMGHFREASMRPIDELWQTYERFAKFGVPLQLTEFDIDTRDEQCQADYLRDVMTITFSHPSFSGIVMWGYWEGRHWRPDAALWRRDWSIKPVGEMWKRLVFEQWWTDETARTDAKGAVRTRGFHGTYRITVGEGKDAVVEEVAVGADGAATDVRLR